ncbi:hypothetical protein AtDm6_3448 [Acetobacter tropicalis]|uniref:Uncharacterized protein n=1 Tax=Acetobacter tropicalis TaxID=104102 RepID=A0A094YFQ0_9PROT|nr:hypothetical protein AtDm6_3448 [Acetobacter tropicalis]
MAPAGHPAGQPCAFFRTFSFAHGLTHVHRSAKQYLAARFFSPFMPHWA